MVQLVGNNQDINKPLGSTWNKRTCNNFFLANFDPLFLRTLAQTLAWRRQSACRHAWIGLVGAVGVVGAFRNNPNKATSGGGDVAWALSTLLGSFLGSLFDDVWCIVMSSLQLELQHPVTQDLGGCYTGLWILLSSSLASLCGGVFLTQKKSQPQADPAFHVRVLPQQNPAANAKDPALQESHLGAFWDVVVESGICWSTSGQRCGFWQTFLCDNKARQLADGTIHSFLCDFSWFFLRGTIDQLLFTAHRPQETSEYFRKLLQKPHSRAL